MKLSKAFREYLIVQAETDLEALEESQREPDTGSPDHWHFLMWQAHATVLLLLGREQEGYSALNTTLRWGWTFNGPIPPDGWHPSEGHRAGWSHPEEATGFQVHTACAAFLAAQEERGRQCLEYALYNSQNLRSSWPFLRKNDQPTYGEALLWRSFAELGLGIQTPETLARLLEATHVLAGVVRRGETVSAMHLYFTLLPPVLAAIARRRLGQDTPEIPDRLEALVKRSRGNPAKVAAWFLRLSLTRIFPECRENQH